jgi:DNA-binding transcriptional LysR family regulator
MTCAGTGIAIAQLPLFMIEEYLNKGELISILDEFPIKSAQVYATTYRQKEIPKKLSYFLKYVQERYKIQ